MTQLLKPYEIRTFKKNSFKTSQKKLQYTIEFQCTICCFIHQDLALAEIHQMGCLLKYRLNEKQNKEIPPGESQGQIVPPNHNFQKITSRNHVKKENKQTPSLLNSKKFNMMKYLGLQSFDVKYSPAYRKKGGYKCKYCKCYFHSKVIAVRHLNNSHFLENAEMLQFIDRTNVQKSQSQNFHKIFFKPFPEQGEFQFYKCNYCSYTSKQKYRVHQHLNKFCSQINSQLQGYQIRVAKSQKKEEEVVDKKRCKAQSIQNVKLEQEQEENFEKEIKRVGGDRKELQNVEKQQEDK